MNQQQRPDSDLARASSTVACASEDLGLYAAHIQELVLYLRDEGHILSSIDQHIIEGWWDAGYPLEVVLRTVHERGLRLKARKNPPRGLPLRSMTRYVEKAGQNALQHTVGSRRSTPGDATPSRGEKEHRLRLMLAGLESDVSDASVLRSREDPCQRLLEELLQGLLDLNSSSNSETAVFNALLAMGRRYYDALWQASSRELRVELREEVLNSLGEGAAQMIGAALDETVAELCRRKLRTRDPLFDPDRYWRIS